MRTSTRISQAGGSSSGEAADKLPFSGPPESAPGASCLKRGCLSRHLFFSPAVELADAIDLFRAGPDVDDGIIDASLDDVFGDSASGFSRSRVTTATSYNTRVRAR
ncbi:unnamed protein product [Boreogadus saida]